MNSSFVLLLICSFIVASLCSTHSPTAQPSLRPTSAEIYIMSIEQNLIGVAETEFNADLENNSLAFAASVTNALEGIDIDNVAINSIKADSSSSVHVHYKVTYNIATLGYSGNPNGAYNHLLGELKAAITNSDFNTYLTNNAVTYAASDLASATSDSIESSYFTDSSGKVLVEPNHQKRQTRYFEIGVIAGGGGFLVLVWLVVGSAYYCSKHYSEEVDGPKPTGTAGFEAVKTKEVELTPGDGNKV